MGKVIDLTNQRFGLLTVLRQSGKDKSGKIMWLCKCDCGNEKIIRGGDLRSGKIQSCGCLHKQKLQEGYQKYLIERNKSPQYRINLINQKFGRLTVLEYDQETTIEKRKTTTNKISWWKCQCECGNVISVSTSALTSGHTKSCGCLKQEQASKMGKEYNLIGAKSHLVDLTGQKFNKLTVLRRAQTNTSSNKPRWVCQCDCGNIIEVSGECLKQGDTKSCGCLGKSVGEYIIRELLLKNKIPFLSEVKFPDLKDKGYLRFDFALLDKENKIVKLIEFDGRQHSDSSSIWHTEEVIKHDQMKNEYCQLHHIPLLRISYRDINKISLDYLLNNITIESAAGPSQEE